VTIGDAKERAAGALELVHLLDQASPASHSSSLTVDRPALHLSDESVPPSVSVIVPALNEAENIGWVLARIPSWVTEVIVVDGHSYDGTADVARAARPGVRVIHQDTKGKGNALACGFAAASGDILVMLDADGSTDPTEIPRFVAALRTGADFAKGTRFMTGGGSSDISGIRKAGNRALSFAVNTLWGSKYSDLCYGYNAFWRRCLPKLHIDCNGFEVETLLNIKAARAGLKIVEVPSFESDRLSGSSNLSATRDGIRVLRTILAESIRPR
jgi:glycosyltransferase involved in cell wall biosynthesis